MDYENNCGVTSREKSKELEDGVKPHNQESGRKLHTHMNPQRSSFARLDTDTENLGRSVNGSVKERLKKFYEKMNILENLRKKKMNILEYWRKEKMNILEYWSKEKMNILENWRKTVLLACVAALAIDPLFLFIPEIDSTKTCFTFNKEVGVAVCVLRTFIDIFYQIHFMFPFIHKLIHHLPQDSWTGVLLKAVKEKHILFYLIVDSVSVLPIPQVVVLRAILQSTSPVSKSLWIRTTKWIIVGQYLPRIIRIYPLYKEVTKTSGTIADSKYFGAAINLFLFLLCSYVFGAFWYVNGVQKKIRCWRDVCATTTGCNRTKLVCQVVDNSRFLIKSCPLTRPDKIENLIENSSNVYDFGMYIEVLKSGVAEVKLRDFPKKFFYCFWWGLQNLSTFGQNAKPGDSATDIFFAIIICASGLSLFTVFIGNVQKYMISTTVRVEERKDTEKWMTSRNLPDDLKERIRKYDTYKWQEFRGTKEDARLLSLPKDLRLETKRHLYKDVLNCVSSLFVGLLETTNDRLLQALYDRVKSVYYPAKSCIVKEGDQFEKILIVTKGTLECITKDGDHNNTVVLEEGGVYGDLHVWIRNPTPSSDRYDRPTTNTTVTTLMDVEAFILLPDDLQFIASQLEQP